VNLLTGAICIIPARGGSKGIPHKNIVDLCGKPLIVWSIEQALAVEAIGRVIVATDDEAIADVATDHDAEVFFRTAATATDEASSESALLEVLRHQTELPLVTVFLQATSPIRQPLDIPRCVFHVQTCCDSVFSCRPVEGYTWCLSKAYGNIRPNYTVREPRQDTQTMTLEENGSIYAFRTEGFLREKVRLFGHVACHWMHPLDSFQVDEPSDLEMMATLLPLRMPHACHAAAAN
jgi:N-acylneuraminate cytidylyltransferase